MDATQDGILNTRRLRALTAGLLLGASAAQAQDLGKPMILVASPDANGAFAGTVLLAVSRGDLHVGFILNRLTERKLVSALPEHPASAKVVDPIHFGGPDASGAIFAVVHRDPGLGSSRLFGDIYMTANAKAVERLVAQRPNEARYFAGSVNWRSGELAAEIEDGLWYTAEPTAALVFSRQARGMYDELAKRLGKGHLPPRGLHKTSAGVAAH